MKNIIKSFYDLEVYQNSYRASIIILKEIIPKLPKEEKDDLATQLRRSVKAIPRLIAEGYGKRHQKRGFNKYIDDALSESNETIVGLYYCKEVYFHNMDINLCLELIDIYDKTSRQLFNLGSAWANFKKDNLTNPNINPNP